MRDSRSRWLVGLLSSSILGVVRSSCVSVIRMCYLFENFRVGSYSSVFVKFRLHSMCLVLVFVW